MSKIKVLVFMSFLLLIGVLAACSTPEVVSVESTTINAQGELVITYTDGRTENLGVVRGPAGPEGPSGAPGAPGEDGEDGSDGSDGAPGDDGLDGADGAQGPTGSRGLPGADGREVQFNVSATHIQWRYVGETPWTNLIPLSELRGNDGVQGPQAPVVVTASNEAELLALLSVDAVDVIVFTDEIVLGNNVVDETIDFNGKTLLGDLFLITNNTGVVTFTGAGTLDGNFTIDAANVTLNTDLNVLGVTTILALASNTLNTTGLHELGIIVKGGTSINASGQAITAKVTIDTDGTVTISGDVDEIIIQEGSPLANLVINGGVRRLSVRSNANVTFTEEAKVEDDIDVDEGVTFTPTVDPSAEIILPIPLASRVLQSDEMTFVMDEIAGLVFTLNGEVVDATYATDRYILTSFEYGFMNTLVLSAPQRSNRTISFVVASNEPEFLQALLDNTIQEVIANTAGAYALIDLSDLDLSVRNTPITLRAFASSIITIVGLDLEADANVVYADSFQDAIIAGHAPFLEMTLEQLEKEAVEHFEGFAALGFNLDTLITQISGTGSMVALFDAIEALDIEVLTIAGADASNMNAVKAALVGLMLDEGANLGDLDGKSITFSVLFAYETAQESANFTINFDTETFEADVLDRELALLDTEYTEIFEGFEALGFNLETLITEIAGTGSMVALLSEIALLDIDVITIAGADATDMDAIKAALVALMTAQGRETLADLDGVTILIPVVFGYGSAEASLMFELSFDTAEFSAELFLADVLAELDKTVTETFEGFLDLGFDLDTLIIDISGTGSMVALLDAIAELDIDVLTIAGADATDMDDIKVALVTLMLAKGTTLGDLDGESIVIPVAFKYLTATQMVNFTITFDASFLDAEVFLASQVALLPKTATEVFEGYAALGFDLNTAIEDIAGTGSMVALLSEIALLDIDVLTIAGADATDMDAIKAALLALMMAQDRETLGDLDGVSIVIPVAFEYLTANATETFTLTFDTSFFADEVFLLTEVALLPKTGTETFNGFDQAPFLYDLSTQIIDIAGTGSMVALLDEIVALNVDVITIAGADATDMNAIKAALVGLMLELGPTLGDLDGESIVIPVVFVYESATTTVTFTLSFDTSEFEEAVLARELALLDLEYEELFEGLAALGFNLDTLITQISGTGSMVELFANIDDALIDVLTIVGVDVEDGMNAVKAALVSLMLEEGTTIGDLDGKFIEIPVVFGHGNATETVVFTINFDTETFEADVLDRELALLDTEYTETFEGFEALGFNLDTLITEISGTGSMVALLSEIALLDIDVLTIAGADATDMDAIKAALVALMTAQGRQTIRDLDEIDITVTVVFEYGRATDSLDFTITFDITDVPEASTLALEVLSALDYEYDPAYSVVGEITLDNNTFTATYTVAQIFENGAVNDLARLFGALYRQDDSTVLSIEFDGVVYTWDASLDLIGSNWANDGTTLVSVITLAFMADQDAPLVVTLSDGLTELDVTFIILLESTLEAEVLSALDYEYDPIYEVIGDYDLTGTTLTGTYSVAEILSGAPMNDLARYLGALHRQVGSTVLTIRYDGVLYTWNQDGVLLGSNWEDDSGVTLVSVLVADYIANEDALVLTLSDGFFDLVLTVVVEARDIPSLAGTVDELSILVEALEEAELIAALEGEGPFTVFAPTNDAFAALLLELEITKQELLELDGLSEILLYHVIALEISSTDLLTELADGPVVANTLLTGVSVVITLDAGIIYVNGFEVLTADVLASNGVVHLIDGVLLPPTVFEFDVDLEGLEFIAGLPVEVDVTLQPNLLGLMGYENVRFVIEVDGLTPFHLYATDTLDNTFDVAQLGFWGPASGFEVAASYTATTTFTAFFYEAGTYTITMQLVDLDTNLVIAEEEVEIIVEASLTAAEVIALSNGADAFGVFQVIEIISANTYFVQDVNGDTFAVFSSSNVALIEIGDYVYLSGTRGTFNGLNQIVTPELFLLNDIAPLLDFDVLLTTPIDALNLENDVIMSPLQGQFTSIDEAVIVGISNPTSTLTVVRLYVPASDSFIELVYDSTLGNSSALAHLNTFEINNVVELNDIIMSWRNGARLAYTNESQLVLLPELSFAGLDALFASFLSSDLPSTTSDDLTLTTTFTIGTVTYSIEYSSDKPAFLANDGTVTRPAEGEDDELVTLTITITNGNGYTLVLTEEVTVLAQTNDPVLLYSTGFEATEDFAASTTYNNTTIRFDGPVSEQWGTYYGTPSTTGPLAGSQSMQMRWYTSAPANLGYTYTDFDVSNVARIDFLAAKTSNINVEVSISVDGGATWIAPEVFVLTTSSTQYSYNVPEIHQESPIRVKFQITFTTTPASGSRLTIDDVEFFGFPSP